MKLVALASAWVVCLMLCAQFGGCPRNTPLEPDNANSGEPVTRSITVTAPVAATEDAAPPTYPAGSTLAVRWSSIGNIPNVRIELLYDPDAAGDPDRAHSVYAVLADVRVNDGVYDWAVPGTSKLLSDYYVRVSDSDDGGVFDVSCEVTIGSPPSQSALPDSPSGPSPSNKDTNVRVESDLYWANAVHATSYNVHFGSSNPPPLAGNTASSTWELPTMTHGVTYYWKIVALNDAGAVAGPVWSFTTAPPPVKAPDAPGGPVPPDDAVDVSIAASLDWGDAARAKSYDVYFGTSDPPPLAGHSTSSLWPPNVLNYSTTYYWQVVADNSAGSEPGPVWSFTTTQPPLTPPDEPGGPKPLDGATAVSLDLELSWDNVARAVSYDVFFGTSNPPPLIGNTTSSSWALDALVPSTTYYWAVVAINGAGQTPGPVWSYTTAAVAAGDMAFIPAGEFQMGDAFDEGTGSEVPVHAVYVDAFYMDVCEVTNQQYAAALNWALAQGGLITIIGDQVYQAGSGTDYIYCDTTGSSASSRITWDGSTFGVVPGKHNHPMVMVSWYGAVAYCNWRSSLEGKPTCYDLSSWSCDFGTAGYRLPTEAEWERAARGGAGGYRYPWSDQDTIQHTRASYWSRDATPYDTSETRGDHPVWGVGPEPFTSAVGFFSGALQYREDWDWPGAGGTYQTSNSANGYGLYDLAANVWEWCNDWYHSSYYDFSPYENPPGADTGIYRSMRGGSWDNSAYGARLANRGKNEPYDPEPDDGFRCVVGTH